MAPALVLAPGFADALQLARSLGAPQRPVPAVEVTPAPGGRGLLLRASEALARFPPGPQRKPYPHPTDTVIVTLSVNAVPKGEHFVRVTPEGKFLARVADVQAAAYLPQGPEIFEIEGEDYLALDALPGSEVSFDEKTLTLAVKLSPQGFPPQVYDLRAPEATAEMIAAPRSALLNYRLAHTGVAGEGSGTFSASADAALWIGGWLLRNQSFHSRFDGEWSHSRLETQLVRDDRPNLRRLILGDSTTPGQPLSSAVPFAGITFAKSYLLAPGFNRHPAVGYRGFADYPSQVDFYVGNTLVTRQQVGPGPFDIRNFNYYGGRRDVRVVVRDVFGREQTIAYPFYFTDLGLAKGLHDYSYQAGWVREGVLQESGGYGGFMASAYHHYGFTDWLTLGFRAEATRDFANAGPAIFFRSERAGQFAIHASGSVDREGDREGSAFSVAHAFQHGDLSTQVLWQRYSDAYRVLGSTSGALLPREDFTASVGYSLPGWGSLGAAFTRLALRDRPPERSVSLTYALPFLRRFNLSAILRHNLDDPKGHEIFVGLQYLPNLEQTVNLTGTRDVSGARTYTVNASNRIPPGEGIAYAVSADRRESPSGEATHAISPRLLWYTRHATVGAELIHQEGHGIDGTTAYTVSLQGAAGATGGRAFATRPIHDSFAMVQVTPPLEGVRVYENSQEIGRTDANGRILLPNVTAYANNTAAIQHRDVPIEFAIDRVSRAFSPPSRSGTFVEFRLERIRAVTGRLLGAAGAPLAHNLLTIKAGDREIEAPTGKEGEFYVESVPAGRHRAWIVVAGRRCDLEIEIPESNALEVDLGGLEACGAKP